MSRAPDENSAERQPFRMKSKVQHLNYGGAADVEASTSANLRRTSSAMSTMGRSPEDVRREFVERLTERPEFADSGIINHEALARGRQKLLDALDGRPMTGGVDEDLPNILVYKGRPLITARVLHLAVWCSAHLQEEAAMLVELVLKEGCDNFAKAKYKLESRKRGWTCELCLDALHIACGLGCLAAVEVLVQHVANQAGESAAKGSTPCRTPGSRKREMAVQEFVNMYTIKCYQDEANPGNCMKDNFYMPIHEAFDKGYIDVALYLLQKGANGREPNLDGLAPLHFLAMRGPTGSMCRGSHDLLREVVQALQEANGSLETRVNPQHYNTKWAGKTPMELASADDSRFPRQMMWLLVPCLQDNSCNMPRFFDDIAFLTGLDAEAATEVVREIRRRAAKNATILHRLRVDAQSPGRTDLIAGILFLAPEAGSAMLEMLVGDPLVQDVSKHNIPTRTSLYGFWKHLSMRCIYHGDTKKSDDKAAMLLPIWKFDINQGTFENQPEIAWHRWLVPETHGLALRTDYVYNVTVSTVLLPNILDLDMFVALGRVLHPHIRIFSKLSVQGMIHCLWNNLVEYVWCMELLFHLVELVALVWWGLAWPIAGPRAADKADKPLCWALITAGGFRELFQVTLAAYGCLRKYQGHTNPTLKSLWHPSSALFVQWAVPKLVTTLVQLRFAWGAREDLGDRELSELDQVLLATTVLMQATQVIYMFRLCTGGSKIYAIFYSFLGGATREMLSITAMIFGSFSLAFLVLAKDKAVGWVLASSYRGLLFGDGDGFNNLGLDVDEERYASNDSILMAFLVLGSFFFNIILLNLIIAVYGNEYDKVAGETPLHFLHGRAQYCVIYVMSCQLFPWFGLSFNWALKLVAGFLVLIAALVHARNFSDSWELSTALLFAAAEVLLQAALAQCDWFSIEGVAADGKDHFLWICHRDFNEANTDNEPLHVGHFEEQLTGLRSHVDGCISSLEDKLNIILDKLTEIR